MFKRKLSEINLVIVSDKNHNNDDLTFLTWFSFNKNFAGIKSLIYRKKRNNSNINYWTNSFNVFSLVGDFDFKKINNLDFLDNSFFIVKSGIIFSKSELNLEESFDFYKDKGILYKNKNSNLINNNQDLIGTLDSDTSTVFIDLNPWIDNLNLLKLNCKLSLCYGEPEFLKGKGTANQINFGYLLKDACKVYTNFPEVSNV